MSQTNTRLATLEELQMIKNFLILPLVLSVFLRDQKNICTVVKTPEPYNKVIQRAMDRISKDLFTIKIEFKKRGIRVFDESHADGARCKYLCRGYQSELSLMQSLLRTEVEQRMLHYLGGL